MALAATHEVAGCGRPAGRQRARAGAMTASPRVEVQGMAVGRAELGGYRARLRDPAPDALVFAKSRRPALRNELGHGSSRGPWSMPNEQLRAAPDGCAAPPPG